MLTLAERLIMRLHFKSAQIKKKLEYWYWLLKISHWNSWWDTLSALWEKEKERNSLVEKKFIPNGNWEHGKMIHRLNVAALNIKYFICDGHWNWNGASVSITWRKKQSEWDLMWIMCNYGRYSFGRLGRMNDASYV